MRLRVRLNPQKIKAKFKQVVNVSGSGGGTWGTITGIITDQTDLVSYVTSRLVGYATEAWVNAQGFVTNVITALGYTPENVANKAINLTSPDNTKYPTTQAVADGLNGKVSKSGDTMTGNLIMDGGSSISHPSNNARYGFNGFDQAAEIIGIDGSQSSSVYVDGLSLSIAHTEGTDSQVITLDNSIDLDSTTKVNINAPEVDLTATNSVLKAPIIQAKTSAGGIIKSSNGTNVAEYGAGGGDNWTFEGGVKLNASTADRILGTDANKNITALNTTTYPTLTELSYVKGVTSGIQSQINGKENTITTLPISKGGTNSGTALNNNRVIVSNSGAIVEANAITANRALVSNSQGIPEASTVSDTTLAFLDATSSVQTQLNNRIEKNVATTYTTNALTTVTAAEYAALTKNAQTLYFIV